MGKTKVLLAFPVADNQTGVHIKDSFEALGCEVTVVDAKVEPEKTVAQAIRVKPDILFCSRTPTLLPSVEYIRTRMPWVWTACWNVDTRSSVKKLPHSEKLLKLFDRFHVFYTIAVGNIEEYQEICRNTKVLHLQQGMDPRSHGPVEITDEDRAKYGCDVMFAGSVNSVHGDREEIISYVKKQGFNMKFYGPGNYVKNEEHSKACRCAKVVIGHSGWPKTAISMSVRDYKVMGCGGFLLTNAVKDIEKWFEVGKMCDTYASKEECVEKIRYYLEHEDERKAIAEHGQEMVSTKHRYLDRMKSVLENYKNLVGR